MKINITTIKRERGASIDFSFALSPKEILLEEFVEIFPSNVLVDGNVTNLGTSLLVVGKIRTTSKNVCARCLQELIREVELDFSEEFYSSKDEINDEDVYTYQEEFLNIKDLVSELLLIEQPIKTLCQVDCNGICPVCGVNLNDSSCNCINVSINPKLLALKDYKFN